MDALSALSALQREARDRNAKKLILFLRERIADGLPFWRAFEESGAFPGHVVALVRIGEESGRFSENLRVVARQQQKEAAFRSQIRSALLYPFFVFAVTISVGLGVAWFSLPRLATLFTNLRAELPAITKILIGVSQALQTNAAPLIAAFLAAVFAVWFFLFSFSRTKFLGHAIVLHIPGLSRLVREVEIARFGYTLGLLLRAGLPAVEALRSLQGTASMLPYENTYARLAQRVEEGFSFEKSFRLLPGVDGLIPPSLQQMIAAGEQSGRLAETLIQIGETFETRVEGTAKNFSVMLEPVLLVVVWVGVIAVAIAVVLPIYNLIGSFNRQ